MKSPKSVSYAVLLPLLFLTCAFQTDSTDYVEQIREILKEPPGVSSGWSEKQLNRLGDRVSVALMKIYSEENVKDPQNIRRCLPLIVQAFQVPRLVPADDRQPQVTIIFLKFLEDEVNDKALKAEIVETRSLVIEETQQKHALE
jgi:hypothetical protein